RAKRARFGTASPHKSACLGHIDRFAETSGQFMPHLSVTYLYLSGGMKELYRDFAEDRRLNDEDSISYPYFAKMWKKFRPNIQPKTGGTFMKCDECTRLKATRFGAPGIVSTTIQWFCTTVPRLSRFSLYLIELDRACLLRDEQRAIDAKRDREPLRFVSIQADAAAQTAFALPMLSPLTHGTDRGYAERQKIMAVLVEGQFIMFLTPQNLGGGCNLICTALHHAFNRLFEKHVPAGRKPPAKTPTCSLAHMSHSLTRPVTSVVGFVLVLSHGRLSTGCKHRNLFTREEQARAFSESYKTVPVHTTTLRNLGNFKGVVFEAVRKIHGISKPRAFHLARDGDDQVTVGMKEHMHKEAYTGMTRDGVFTGEPHELFIGSIPRVEDAPPFELKAVDETTLEKIQQRYDCVHPRLKALYPDDPAKREHIVRQMNHSVACLREDGTKDWDLPSFDERYHDDGESCDDQAPDNDDSGVSDTSSVENSDSLDTTSQESSPDLEGDGGDAPTLHYLEPGCFVVFPLQLSNPCSLEVGQIVSVDLTADEGGEVIVHWYTPARKQKCRRSRYGKGVWSPVYVMEGNRRVPDKGRESVNSACFTFPSLLQSGKLPTAVWAAVEKSVPTTSLEEVDSDSETED
ncbi:unnamed protein product, partial [Scytosiphon promiscuus]